MHYPMIIETMGPLRLALALFGIAYVVALAVRWRKRQRQSRQGHDGPRSSAERSRKWPLERLEEWQILSALVSAGSIAVWLLLDLVFRIRSIGLLIGLGVVLAAGALAFVVLEVLKTWRYVGDSLKETKNLRKQLRELERRRPDD